MHSEIIDGIDWELIRRSGRSRVILEAWLEARICENVPLDKRREDELLEAHKPDIAEEPEDHLYAATRLERLTLFKRASFLLQVEERFSRTKSDRDRLIYSMLRCRNQSRVAELAIAIREGEIDFAAAAIRWSEGPESASGGRIGPIPLKAGHPDLNKRLAVANPGELIGPFCVGNDAHVLLRLDHRITARLDEDIQQQLIEELYGEWRDGQIDRMLNGDTIKPIEYLPE